MLEKIVLYALNKPKVKTVSGAFIWEVHQQNKPTKTDTPESRETLIGKLVNDVHLYRQVMDDLRKNPHIPSPYHKFPSELYRAALRLNYVLNNPEQHLVPLTQESVVPVEQV